MENLGWIKLHRKFLTWEWYDEPHMVKFFIHLLITVNHKDKKWHGIVIKRGQRIVTIRGLAKEMKVSVRTIRTLIKRLKSTHEVTQQATHRYTMLTLCNYDDYQQREKPTDTVSDTVSDTRATHQRHILKNEKKERTNNIEGAPPKKSSLEWLRLKESREALKLEFPAASVAYECDRMINWVKANGKRKKDYQAFARNWLTKSVRESKPEPQKLKWQS